MKTNLVNERTLTRTVVRVTGGWTRCRSKTWTVVAAICRSWVGTSSGSGFCSSPACLRTTSPWGPGCITAVNCIILTYFEHRFRFLREHLWRRIFLSKKIMLMLLTWTIVCVTGSRAWWRTGTVRSSARGSWVVTGTRPRLCSTGTTLGTASPTAPSAPVSVDGFCCVVNIRNIN